MSPNLKNIYEIWPETQYKAVTFHEFSDMRSNLGREGRDPGQMGHCPNLLVLKASLREAIKSHNRLNLGNHTNRGGVSRR